MEAEESRKRLLCFGEAKVLMLPESAGFCWSASHSSGEWDTHPETTESQRCFYQVLPALLLEACHIHAGLGAFVYDLHISLFLFSIQVLPSLQGLAHVIHSRRYPTHSEAPIMNNSFPKLKNNKNCFNDLSPLWAGLSCQVTLKFSQGINHVFCFLRIYYPLETCGTYGT